MKLTKKAIEILLQANKNSQCSNAKAITIYEMERRKIAAREWMRTFNNV